MSLRNLSMVLRQLPVVDKAAPGKQVLESVELARQAVQLDVADGTSWCECQSRSLECMNLNECVENQWHFQFNEKAVWTTITLKIILTLYLIFCHDVLKSE